MADAMKQLRVLDQANRAEDFTVNGNKNEVLRGWQRGSSSNVHSCRLLQLPRPNCLNR